MKKKILFIAVVAVSVLVAFLTSCSKEDKMCTCSEESTDYYDNYSATQELDPASFGATNCSDLTVKLNMDSSGDYYYDCY